MEYYEFYNPLGVYAVARFNPKRARLERWGADGWIHSPTEFQMIFDPDPGEGANSITQAQARALIDTGDYSGLTAADIATFGT